MAKYSADDCNNFSSINKIRIGVNHIFFVCTTPDCIERDNCDREQIKPRRYTRFEKVARNSGV